LENSDFLLLKNNNLMLVSQSDFVDFKLWENATYLHKIGNTQKLKAQKTLTHSILYIANLPYGAVGFKYAVGGKIGGYVSGAFSMKWYNLTYLTGGFLGSVSSKVNLYLGAGVGPYISPEKFWLEAFVLETGTLLYLNRVSLDFGLGINFEESLYGKIGFGFNF
jgi:hypothetical protein